MKTEVRKDVYKRQGQSNPDHPVSVAFSILGRNYTVNNVYYPEDGQQLVWVKWHTPVSYPHLDVFKRQGGYLQSGRCLGEVWQKGAKGF